MADRYVDVEHGYMFDVQSDLPWTQTNRMTLRAPAIANRIFDTLAHAQAYIDDISPKASAVPGLLLSVFADTLDDKNNGFYRVVSVKKSAGDAAGVLEKVGSGGGGASLIEVTNITTDLAEYAESNIYFISDTVTGRKYQLLVGVLDGITTQILWGVDSWKKRTLQDESGDEVVWSDWETLTYEVTANKVTSWSDTPSDTKYPSEKLVKESLDLKMERNGKVTDAVKDLLKSWLFRTTAGEESITDGSAKIAQYYGNVDNDVPFFATKLHSVGFNAFNPNNVLNGYAIDESTGALVASSGSKVAFVRVLEGESGSGKNNGYVVYPKAPATVTRVGFSTNAPAAVGDTCTILTATTNGNSTSYIPTGVGYLWIMIDNIADLCVHLAWSGYRDTDVEEYAESECNLPMVHTWGMGLAGLVYDEVNYLTRQKITRVDRAELLSLEWEEHQEVYTENDEEHIRYYYTTSDLVASIKASTTNIRADLLGNDCVVTVDSTGVVTISTGTIQKDPDVEFLGHIYYELAEVIVETMEAELQVTVSDFGTEEIIGNGVYPHAISMFYLSNLEDFLRALYLNKDEDNVDVEKITFMSASSVPYVSDKPLEVVSISCYACNTPCLNGTPIAAGSTIAKDIIYALSVTMTDTNAVIVLKTRGIS